MLESADPADFTITIESTRIRTRFTPRWDTLQTAIIEMIGYPGDLVRIARKDGKCDYRAPGDYTLGFRIRGKTRPEEETVTIDFSVR